MPALTPFLCVWNDSSHPPQCTGPDHLHKLPLCIHLQAGFQVIAVEQPDPELTTCYSLYLLFESVVRSWGPSLKNCVTLCNLAHMQASANPFCQVALPTLCKARWPASKWHKGIAETADRNRATVGSKCKMVSSLSGTLSLPFCSPIDGPLAGGSIEGSATSAGGSGAGSSNAGQGGGGATDGIPGGIDTAEESVAVQNPPILDIERGLVRPLANNLLGMGSSLNGHSLTWRAQPSLFFSFLAMKWRPLGLPDAAIQCRQSKLCGGMLQSGRPACEW
eukprot:1149362-Pelagomonas_calceolata.AAC.1